MCVTYGVHVVKNKKDTHLGVHFVAFLKLYCTYMYVENQKDKAYANIYIIFTLLFFLNLILIKFDNISMVLYHKSIII